MKKIGLTGGIGSGKSTVAELFQYFGIPVFNSDDVARKLQREDAGVKKAISKLFGSGIYVEGHLNRGKVAEIIFGDKDKLKALNAIVHPAVAKDFEKFCEDHADAKYVLKEAAILFEIADEKSLDGMIVVAAPDALRIHRVMLRDKISKEEVLKRLKNQMSQEEKVTKADFLIMNDEKTLVIPQVLAIHSKLSA